MFSQKQMLSTRAGFIGDLYSFWQRNLLHTIVFAALLALSACGSNPPVFNIEGSPIPLKTDGSKLSMNEISTAIIHAATYKRWTTQKTGEGKIRANIYVRSHTAITDIEFNDESFSIQYVDSSNLEYKNGKIHGNYNKWIGNLNREIQLELNRIASGMEPRERRERGINIQF